MSRPVIADQRAAALAGVLCLAAGVWLLRDAYERRGKSRPFPLRILGAA